MQYQPYRGYGYAHPGYWNRSGPPTRLRTRSASLLNWYFGWCWECWAHHAYAERQALPAHAHRGDAWWQQPHASTSSVFQKRLVHRQFRAQAKRLIARELAGDEAVSHAFRICGDYLD